MKTDRELREKAMQIWGEHDMYDAFDFLIEQVDLRAQKQMMWQWVLLVSISVVLGLLISRL